MYGRRRYLDAGVRGWRQVLRRDSKGMVGGGMRELGDWGRKWRDWGGHERIEGLGQEMTDWGGHERTERLGSEAMSVRGWVGDEEIG